MATPSFPLDRTTSLPLFRQLYLRIRQSIAEGRLQAGDRMPAVRGLAAELNVARGTVDAAYQQLIDEGYLVTRGPAGTVVAPGLRKLDVPTRATTARRVGRAHEIPAPLPFQLGLPALDAFPRALWQRLVNRELRRGGVRGLDYPDPCGYVGLREAVAAYLGVSRGIACEPSQLFICAGYRACLDLAFRAVASKGDACWFEDPGYFHARDVLVELGARLVPVPVDGEGMDIAAAQVRAADARLAVVTPTHQSPLGVSLSLPRRLALLDWASRREGWIIEDDYDSEYRYVGRPLPAMKSLDVQGRVIYAGTFSKVLVPGLRLAYLVVPPAHVERFATLAERMQMHCPHLMQAAVAAFLTEGHFGRHLRRMRGLYAERRGMLVDALRRHLPDRLRFDPQAGGMHLLGHLDDAADDVRLAQRANAMGLAVQALSSWYVGGSPRRGLLLGFTNVADPGEADALASRLAVALA